MFKIQDRGKNQSECIIPEKKQILKHYKKKKKALSWGLPGDSVVKNPPANAGDTASIPGPGRSHMLGATKAVSPNY